MKKLGKANLSKEKIKSITAGVEEKVPNYEPLLQSHPYGTWKKVELKEDKPVDLELPYQELIPISVPKLRENSEKKFQEKVYTSEFASTTQQEAVFKKRKIALDVRKNIRQRLNDD